MLVKVYKFQRDRFTHIYGQYFLISEKQCETTGTCCNCPEEFGIIRNLAQGEEILAPVICIEKRPILRNVHAF